MKSWTPERKQNPILVGLRLLLAFMLAFPPSAWSNPFGGTVAAGQANINGSGGVVTVNQQSNNAIINWQGFSISVGELTKFVQPSALSAVLNRVTGGDPSAIYGTLQANGRVFLINPNGIVVGASGVISAQSFIASTLDVNNDQFMSGDSLLFSGSSLAGLQNAGKIEALGGDVMLIAHTVQNTGAISAAQGTAALAAGSEVLLKPAGDPERIFVQAGNGVVAVGVDQKGQIMAATAELKAADGNVYGLAINNSGNINATGVETKDGHVYLTATGGSVVNSGLISATQGDKGGTVRIAADDITLKNGSVVDVSGATGGGTALIGGGAHGADASMPNAKNVTVEAGANIKADATDTGNGGNVVVWSDKSTVFQGAISAKGGANGGDGGFAEVSGKDFLDFEGIANLGAANGTVGTLLLDPTNLTIQTDGTSVSCTGTNPETCTPSGVTSILTISILQAALASSNVIVTTVGGYDSHQSGDIDILNNIAWNSAHYLALTAAGNINVGANINATGLGAITMNSAGINLGTKDGTTAVTGASLTDITTNSGAQTYNAPIVLYNSEERLNSHSGLISINSTVDGHTSGTMNLALRDDAGNISIGADIGNIHPLASLNIITGTGITYIGGPTGPATTDPISVQTSGLQYYGQAVVLRDDASLISTSGGITFKTTVNSNSGLAYASGPSGPYYLRTTASGDTTFGGAVGGTGTLGSLTADITGSGSIYLDGGSANTYGLQDYEGPVVLGADTTLTARNNGIIFDSTVDSTIGATGPFSLTARSEGFIEFNGAVGGGTGPLGPLSRLNVTVDRESGEDYIDIDGGSVKTSGSQDYYGSVNIDQQDAALTSTAGDITFHGTVDSFGLEATCDYPSCGGPYGLTTTSLGSTYFEGAVGAVAPLGFLTANITGSGAVHLDGGVVNTDGTDGGVSETGSQLYNGKVSLGADASLTAIGATGPTGATGDITFSGTVDSVHYSDTNYGLTTNSTGATGPLGYAGGITTFGYAVGASGGTGPSTALAFLDVTAINGAGTIYVDGGGITTLGDQTYNGNVYLNKTAALTAANGGNGGSITFNGNVDGYDSILASNPDLTISADKNVTFNSLVGSDVINDLSVTSGASGSIYLRGGDIYTYGNQDYHGPVIIGNANADLDSTNGSIIFYGAVDSLEHDALSVHAASNVIFDGLVGGNGALGSLSAWAGDSFRQSSGMPESGVIEINGGGVTTWGDQDYNSPVWINTNNASLTALGGDINFDDTVDSVNHSVASVLTNYGLSTHSTGDTYFHASVGASGATGPSTALASLDAVSDYGSINISGGYDSGADRTAGIINTIGNQTYTGDVRVGDMRVGNQTQSVDLTAGGYDAELSATQGSITFNGKVDSQDTQVLSTDGYGLSVTAQNDITFNGAVGSEYPLDHLFARSIAGDININGGQVTTWGGESGNLFSGSQIYMGNVAIGQRDAVLSTDPYFSENMNYIGGVIYFGDSLTDLTPISLSNILNPGGSITSTDHYGLTLSSLVVYLGGPVGQSGKELDFLNVTALEIAIDAGSIKTLGGQTYNGITGLLSDTTLSAAKSDHTGGAVTFNGPVAGYNYADPSANVDLSVSADGDINFMDVMCAGIGIYDLGAPSITASRDGLIGDLSDTINEGGSGSIYMRGGRIYTYGDQTYSGGVRIENQDAWLRSYDGGVTFGGAVDSFSGRSLNVRAYDDVTFNGAVGATYRLGRLYAGSYDDGAININGGGVTTWGGQEYDGSVWIDKMDASLTEIGNEIKFDGTVDSVYHSAGALTNYGLTTHSTGDTYFYGAVGASGPAYTGENALAFLDATSDYGRIHLHGGQVYTWGGQTYNGDVRIGGYAADLYSEDGDITFNGLVDSYNGLGLSAEAYGDVTFNGAVGSKYPLESLYAGSYDGGAININDGGVTTNGFQQYGGYDSWGDYYNGSVVIGGNDATLNAGGSVTFYGAVDSFYGPSAPYGLAVSAHDGVAFDSAVGARHALDYLTVDSGMGDIAISGGVRTLGDQVYDGSVVLSGTGSAYLSSNEGLVRFEHDVNAAGGQGLSVAAARSIEFDGAVGATGPLGYLDATIWNGLNDADYSNCSGEICLNGGGIKTQASIYGNGDQRYNGHVMIGGQDAVLSAQGATAATAYESGGSVIFNGTLDSYSGYGLSAAADGDVIFNGLVGDDSDFIRHLDATVNAGGWGSIYVNAPIDSVHHLTLQSNVPANTDNEGNIYINAPVDAGELTFSAMNRIYVNADVTADWDEGTISTPIDALTGYGHTFTGPISLDNVAVVGANDHLIAGYDFDSAGNLYLNGLVTNPTSSWAPFLDERYTNNLYVNAPVINHNTSDLLPAKGSLYLNAPVTNSAIGVSDLTSTWGLKGTAVSDIFVKAPISNSANMTLILDATAGGAITVKAPMSNQGTVSLKAKNDINIGAAINDTIGGTGPTGPTTLTFESGAGHAIHLGADIMGGNQDYKGSVVLDKDASLADGYDGYGVINFEGAVDSLNENQKLIIDHDNGSISFGTVGSLSPLASLEAWANSIELNGSGITTIGDQYYSGPVLLGYGNNSNTTLTASQGAITFTSTINPKPGHVANVSLTTNSSGDTIFGGAVGGTGPLGSLTADITGSGSIHINAPAITTGDGNEVDGFQRYNGNVVLGANTILTAGYQSNWAGSILFADTVDSLAGYSLTTASTKDTTFMNAVDGVGDLAVQIRGSMGGKINLNGGAIDTTGDQDYRGPVVVGDQDATLTSGTGDITFHGTVDSVHHAVDSVLTNYGLTTRASYDTFFDGAVGASGGTGPSTALAGLDVSVRAGYGIYLLDGRVTTIGAQDYHGDVDFESNDAVLASQNGSIHLYGLVNSYANYGLSVTAAQDITFDGSVGWNSASESGYGVLGSLVATAGGTINLNGGRIVTLDSDAGAGDNGEQTYIGSVNIGSQNSFLYSFNSDIIFNGALDSSSGLGLTVIANNGNVTFDGAVGAIHALGSLAATSHGGDIEINGGGVTTSGGQDYKSPVWINTNNASLSALGGDIDFEDTVDSVKHLVASVLTNYGLTTYSAGDTSFHGKVGASGPAYTGDNALAFLSATVANDGAAYGDTSIIHLLGGEINTIGDQTYTGEAYIEGGQDALLYAANGNMTFNGGIDSSSGYGLDAEVYGAGKNIYFNESVGAEDELGRLYAYTQDGAIYLNGGKVYTAISGSNSGYQDYWGPVVIGKDADLRAAGSTYGGEITFEGTVDSVHHLVDGVSANYGLTTHSYGDTTFDGAIGAGGGTGPTTALAFLDVTTTHGTIYVDGDGITTLGDQTYNGNVFLRKTAALTAANGGNGGSITFNGAVDGYDSVLDSLTDLTISADGNVSMGNVGDGDELGKLTVAINPGGSGNIYLRGGDVYTVGDQTYTGDVRIQGEDAILDSSYGSVTFNGAVDAPADYDGNFYGLAVSAYNDVTFTGAVGNKYALDHLYVGSYDGNINLNGGVIRTYGDQYYGCAGEECSDSLSYSGPTVIGGGKNADLTSFNGEVWFANGVQSKEGEGLIVTADNDIWFDGNVGYSTGRLGFLTLVSNDDIYLGYGSSGIWTGANSYGNGDQSYLGSVLLNGDASLSAKGTAVATAYESGGSIIFNGTVDSSGGYGLSAAADGDVIFNDTVGGNSGVSKISHLDVTINAGGWGSIYVNAPISNVSEVSLTNDVAANNTHNQGNIYINDTLGATGPTGATGPQALNLDSNNRIYVNAAVRVAGGYDDSATGDIEGASVYLNADKTDNIAVTGLKTDDYSIVGNDLYINTRSGVTGHPSGLYDNAYVNAPVLVDDNESMTLASHNGGLYFNAPIVNEGHFIGNADGDVRVMAPVHNRHGNDFSLYATDNGSIYVKAPIYTEGAVLLEASNGSSKGTGQVHLDSYIESLGDTNGSLVMAADNGIYLNSDVWLGGSQEYDGDVILGHDTILFSYAGDITFNGKVDSSVGNNYGLQAWAGLTGDYNGSLTFNGAVGATNPLGCLYAGGYDDVYLNGGQVKTTGGQYYGFSCANGGLCLGASDVGGPVFIGSQNADLQAGGDITFLVPVASDYQYPYGLTTESGGNTNFDASVGAYYSAPLAFLNVTVADGYKVHLRGGGIYTSGDQTYTGDVRIGQSADLLSSAGNITFNGKVDSYSHRDLDVETNGYNKAVTFNGAVGSEYALGDLYASSYAININGGAVTTNGAQEYDAWYTVIGNKDAVMTSNSSYIEFDRNLDSLDHHGLTVRAPATLNEHGYYSDDGVWIDGPVGTRGALSFLDVTSGDGIYLGHAGSAHVITLGDQTYNGDVWLESDTTLTAQNAGNGGSITFNGPVYSESYATGPTGPGGDVTYASELYDLTVKADGNVTFSGLVGGSKTQLRQVSAASNIYDGRLGDLAVTINQGGSGKIHLRGGEIETSGDQTYTGDVRIGGYNAELSSLSGNITFSGTVDSYQGYDLSVEASDGVTFNGAVGSVNALGDLYAGSNGGAIHINGGGVTTYGYQQYGGYDSSDNLYEGSVVISGQNASLTSLESSITFNNTVDSTVSGYLAPVNYGLTTNSHGSTFFYGAVGAGGGGEDDVSYSALAFLDATVGVGHSIHLQGGEVYTIGDQTYHSDVLIGAQDGYLSAIDAYGSYGSITFDGTVNSHAGWGLNIVAAGDISFGGLVGSSDPLGYLYAYSDYGNININGGGIHTTLGDSTVDDTYNTDVKIGDQYYDGNVILGKDAYLEAGYFGDSHTSAGSITFNGRVDSAAGGTGPYGLTTTSSGDTSFMGAVGTRNPLGALDVTSENWSVDHQVLGSIHLQGGDIKTMGDQTFNGHVVIGDQNASLTSLNGSIYFQSDISATGPSGQGLTVTAAGDINFNDLVGDSSDPLGFLTATSNDGFIYINADSVWTSGYDNENGNGDQKYTGAVVIGKDAYLYADSDGNGSGGNITFNGKVDSATGGTGPYGLSTTSSGDTSFMGAVGADTPLGSLYVTSENRDDLVLGNIHLQGGDIYTSGNQTYNGNVRIDAQDAYLSAGSAGSITFDGTVDSAGGFGLDVSAGSGPSGRLAFNGAVGATGPLGRLYASGYEIDINDQVHTIASHADDYESFHDGWDNGDQFYDGQVVLMQNATLTAGGSITFNGTVDSGYDCKGCGGSGPFGLTTHSVGDTNFYGTVGGYESGDDVIGNPLAYLDATADAGSRIYLDGGEIHTTDYQKYTGSVVLGQDTLIGTQGGAVTFEGSLNAKRSWHPQSLVIDTGDLGATGPAAITLDMVGDVKPLDYLDIYGTGDLIMHGDITTLGWQYYDRPVTIAPDNATDSDGPESITLTTLGGSQHGYGSYIEFANTVDGNNDGASELILHTTGDDVYLDDAVGSNIALTSLTVDSDIRPEDIGALLYRGGGLYIGGESTDATDIPAMLINTTGAQNYWRPVYLERAASFTTTGGPVHFHDTVNRSLVCTEPYCGGSSHDLFVNTNGGDLTLDGAVGDAETSAFIELRGGNVTWNGDLTGTYLQILGSNLTMNGNVTATSVSPDDGTGVLMIANNTFKNTDSHIIDLQGGGRWLIYSVDPAWNNKGGLGGSNQWSTTWASGPAPQFAGNGFLYSVGLPLPTPQEQQSYQANTEVLKWDIPTPGTETHGGGFFSVIATPKYTTIYRNEHPVNGGENEPGVTPSPDDDHKHKKDKKTTSISKDQDKIPG